MEKMLVLMMSKDNAKRAAPIGAGLVAALRHCEARSSPDELSWNLLRKEIFQNHIKIFQKS
jgi:hypothetical protein